MYRQFQQNKQQNFYPHQNQQYKQKKNEDTILPGLYTQDAQIGTHSAQIGTSKTLSQGVSDIQIVEQQIREYYLKRKQMCALLQDVPNEKKIRFVKACDEFLESALDILIKEQKDSGQDALQKLLENKL